MSDRPSVAAVSGWSRNFEVDFSDFAEARAGETFSAPTLLSATPSGLTVGTLTVSGSIVYVPLTGFVSGTDYVLTVQVSTSGGATLTAAVEVTVE